MYWLRVYYVFTLNRDVFLMTQFQPDLFNIEDAIYTTVGILRAFIPDNRECQPKMSTNVGKNAGLFAISRGLMDV
jgi:hypothetical protein